MSNPDVVVVKEEQKEIKFKSQSKPSLENSAEDEEAPSSTGHELDQERDDQEEDVVDNKEDGMTVTRLLSPTATSVSEETKEPPRLGQSFEVGDVVVDDDDDEGFKTPTSSEHKIPVTTECPAAPKKPTPQPSRNRRVSSGIHISLQVDMSMEDFENMFPLRSQDDHNHISPKIKKARIDGAL